MKRKIAMLGVPFDEYSSYLRGAAGGPAAIRKAFYSDSSNSWTENNFDLTDVIEDAGDIDGSQQDIFQSIEPRVRALLERDEPVITLGGDHSITFPILKAFHNRYPRLSILHFDAHPDLYHDFEGNPFSHASPFARVMENGLAEKLVQVGIRCANQHQREQAAKFNVQMVEMKHFKEDMTFSFQTPIYISFDTDGLDPAYAPGVSHPEGGGLTTRQVVRIIQSLKGRVVGADIVELNPQRDVSEITAAACSKILKEICGRILEEL
jgi:agmatinase